MSRAALLVALWMAVSQFAQAPGLETVMRRAHGYVVVYEDDLSALVAEEHYEQTVLDDDGDVAQRRRLASDFRVFQIPPEEAWFAVRDVYEVDGRPVRPREDRFPIPSRLEAGHDAFERASEIAQESARYNIGDVVRTINIPTFSLIFLRPSSRHRMHFVKLGEEDVAGLATWIVGYVERRVDGPTFIVTPEGRNLVSRGRFWIEPARGSIVRSELITGDASVDRVVRIMVQYRQDAERDLWLPADMDEVYESAGADGRVLIRGRATYTNYRRVSE